MRKKSDTVVVSKGVAKPTRGNVSRNATAGQTSTHSQEHKPMLESSVQLGASVPNQSDLYEEMERTSACRSRSTTPLETDLLRYLTAHIKEPSIQDKGSFCLDVTSFVIEREEYLQGVVRLIQADCPEVVDDLNSFMACMQEAFIHVKGTCRT
jgi:hypothetical protein